MAEPNWSVFLRQPQTRNTLPMIGIQTDKTAYYNPYPSILSSDYRLRNHLENIYSNKLGRWYPYRLPSLYSKPSDLSHLIGSYDYYWARHIDQALRYPMESKPNYYIEYGDANLRNFLKARNSLSLQGQRWTDSTMLSLQRMLEYGLRNNPNLEKDNRLLSDFAFGTHTDAYIRAGFLDLPCEDLFKIAKTPNWSDVFSVPKNYMNGVVFNTGVQLYHIVPKLFADRLLDCPSEVFNKYFGNRYNYWIDLPYDVKFYLGLP